MSTSPLLLVVSELRYWLELLEIVTEALRPNPPGSVT